MTGAGPAGGPAHTSLAQGALVPTMMHWARAETPGPGFAWGLPKDLIPSMFEAGDGVWIHLMRNADVDSPLMVQAFADLGEEGVAEANAAFAGMATPGYPNFGANRAAFKTRPAQEWLEDFWTHDIPAQPSAQYGAILADEQARANGYVTEVDDPVRGKIIQAGTPFSTVPPSRVTGPAPSLGQHTDEVLAEAKADEPATPSVPAATAAASAAAAATATATATAGTTPAPPPPKCARPSKACVSSIWGISSPALSAPCCWPTSGPT